MAETPTADSGAYQSLSDLRDRVDYTGDELFQDNHQLRFDHLLVRLERESRKIFETLWGDVTPLTETGRTDRKLATDDAAIALVYPIQDVTEVEIKRTQNSEWDTLDTDRYLFTEHRLILAERARSRSRWRRGNVLADNARRATWADIASEIRVTYDRGFGEEPPADIQSIQVALVNRMIRQLRQEQTLASATPEDFAGMSPEFDNVVTDAIRDRVDDVTSPGMATLSM